MRLELVGALLVIAVVATCASAENSGKQNDVDYERSVREALDEDEVQNVLGDDGRSVRNDRCTACYACRRIREHRYCTHLCHRC